MNYDKIDDSKMNSYQKQILTQAKTIKAQRNQVQALKEENAKLTKCVEFYAYNFEAELEKHDEYDIYCSNGNTGKLARQTLKEIKGGE